MCGMTGYSGVDDFNPDKIAMLMLANMTRGTHSTGMYNDGKITKQGGDAISFLATYRIVPEKLFFGHDRHATVGNKGEAKNAHPFKYGNIIGQHNGTLKNHWELLRTAGESIHEYDVDSQAVIKLLSDDDKDAFKVLEEIKGAAALMWIDENHSGRLYCFRNDERPLFRGMIGKNMYISSIEDSLKMIDCKKIQEFKTDFVYAIENGKVNLEASKRIVHKKPTPAPNYNKYGGKADASTHTTRNLPVGGPDHFNQKIKEGNTKGIDMGGKWIKRIWETASNMFTTGKWYRIIGEEGVMWRLVDDQGHKTNSLKTHFTEPEKLNVSGYVVCPYGDKNLFQDNEMLFLRGLEVVNGKPGTTAILEKVGVSNFTYEWGASNFRNAEDAEISSYLSEHRHDSNIVIDPEENSIQVDSEEELKDLFEADEANMDLEGNRLGVCYTEVGSLYESMLAVREDLETMVAALESIVKDNKLEPLLPEFLVNTIRAQNDNALEMRDLLTEEIEKMFEGIYQVYEK